MEKLLKSEELSEKLELLKTTLQHFDYNNLQNITFFNIYSFYTYLSQITCSHGKKEYTITSLLDEIEQYIPLAITDSSLEIFLSAAQSESETELEKMTQLFSYRCRMDFINLVRSAKEPEEWHRIVKACQHLRGQREMQYQYAY